MIIPKIHFWGCLQEFLLRAGASLWDCPFFGKDLSQATHPTADINELGDRNFGRQVNVLNGVEQFYTFFKGTLKGFAAGN